MKNIVIIIIIVVIIAGGAWWYLNQDSLGSNPANQMTVVLETQNGSGQSGIATLTEVNEEVNGINKPVVKLAIKIKSSGKDVSQPTHIHIGSCANLGQPVYPLNPVVNGSSITTIDTTLEQIKASSQPLAINVHKSEAEVNTYVACGNIQLTAGQ